MKRVTWFFILCAASLLAAQGCSGGDAVAWCRGQLALATHDDSVRLVDRNWNCAQAVGEDVMARRGQLPK